ncbi:MAG: hypothetical protein GF355_18140, partial [Candidatus Eisenbacteria bacterium]|nr:hypothetical protein [Candidatus Eisenbacteria bacterium]
VMACPGLSMGVRRRCNHISAKALWLAALLPAALGCEKESPNGPTPDPGPAWERLADVNQPREKAGAMAHDGRVFLMGGRGTDPLAPFPGVEVYDPETAVWELHDELHALNNTGAVHVAHDGLLYAFSGRADNGPVSRAIQVFDPEELTIETLRVQLLQGHKDGAGVAIPGGILIMGGLLDVGSPSDLVERFVPNSTAPEMETRLPYPLQDFSALHHDGRVFVFGGQSEETRIDSVAVYDLISREWEVVDNALPLGWDQPRAAKAGDRILIMSGKGAAGELNGEYDPLLHFWRPLADLPEPRSESAVTVLAGKVWLISGLTGDGEGEVPTAGVLVYDPAAETE